MSTGRAALELDEKTPTPNTNANARASGSAAAPLSFGDSKHTTKSGELIKLANPQAGSLRLVSLHVPSFTSFNNTTCFFADGSFISINHPHVDSTQFLNIAYGDNKRHWQTVPLPLHLADGKLTLLPNRKYAIGWQYSTIYVIEISSMKCQRVLFHSEIKCISPLPDEKHILISYQGPKKQSLEIDAKVNTNRNRLTDHANYQIWDITDPFNGKLKLDFYRNNFESPAGYSSVNEDRPYKPREISNGAYLFNFLLALGAYGINDTLIRILKIQIGEAIEIAAHKISNFDINNVQLLNGFLILIGDKRTRKGSYSTLQIWNISNVNNISLLEEFPLKNFGFINSKYPIYLEKNGDIAVGYEEKIHSISLYESSSIFQEKIKALLTGLTTLPTVIIDLISSCFLMPPLPPIEHKSPLTACNTTKWELAPLELPSITPIQEEKTQPSLASKKTLEAALKLILFAKQQAKKSRHLTKIFERLEQIMKNYLLFKPTEILEENIALIILETTSYFPYTNSIFDLFYKNISRNKFISFEEIDIIKNLVKKYYPGMPFEALKYLDQSSLQYLDKSYIIDRIFSRSYDIQSLIFLEKREKQKFAIVAKDNILADSKAINAVRNLSRYAKSKTSFLRNISCFQDPETDKNAAFSKIDLELKAEEGKPSITLLEKTLLKKVVEIFTTAIHVRLGVTNDRTDSAEALVDLLSGKTTGNDIISAEDVTAIRGLLTKYSNTMIMDYEALKAFVVEMEENFREKASANHRGAAPSP